jgi:hypothetical protein
MALKRGIISVDKGFGAAVRKFPASELAIRRLMARDEAFCEICDELATSEMALEQAARIDGRQGEIGRREWREVIELLTKEIEAALR